MIIGVKKGTKKETGKEFYMIYSTVKADNVNAFGDVPVTSFVEADVYEKAKKLIGKKSKFVYELNAYGKPFIFDVIEI